MRRLTTSILAVVLIGCAVSLAAPVRGQDVINEANVEVTLTLDRMLYQPGEPITFVINVFNPNATPVRLTFTSTQRYDLELRARGVQIGRWSTNRSFATVVEFVEIQPRQSITYADSWVPTSSLYPLGVPSTLITMQPVTSGVYTLHAELTTAGARPTSSAKTVIIGEQAPLNAGCQPLEMSYGVLLPVEVVVGAISPAGALGSLWRYIPLRNTYEGYRPEPLAPNDLTAIRDGDRIIICMNEPGSILMPRR